MKIKALSAFLHALTLTLLCGCGDPKESVEARTPVNPAAVKAFAEAGINVNPSQGVRLNQDLARAVAHGEFSEVETLIQQGATPDAADRYGLKVLFSASKYGKTDVVKALIKAGANVNETVATSHNTDGVGYGGTREGTPLSYAAEAGKIDVMEILAAAGANVNGAGPEGNTPLMRAAEGGQLEAVQWLLSHGASASAKNKFNGTALSVSRMFANPDDRRQEIIRLLTKAQL